MSDDVQARIDTLVKSNPFVLFMKGRRDAPQCGFSARVVDVLDEYLPEYETVDVLSDPGIRQGIKDYASWPTIPQLYVHGEFVGGCDIVLEMNENGELEEVLGVERAKATVPEIFLSEAAVAKLVEFNEGEKPAVIRLDVAPGWQYGMDFDEERPKDVKVEGDGWVVLMKRSVARKVDGLNIDFVQGPQGGGFKIDNPNEPPKVKALQPQDLKTWIDEGKSFELFDVRTPEERAQAHIEGARLLDDAAIAYLEALDRDQTIAFHCHHGMRSLRAAQRALEMGFTDVHNVVGGIDAWSQTVDPSVPRY
tara:strand:+ start:202 stop:1122 length:921 start_codon:yes stop_codon:yes gene_type:complete